MFLNVPAAHAAHCPPSAPVYPMSHVQEVCASDPAGEYECDRHTEQMLSLEALDVVEYLPAPQSVHAALPVAALNLPAAHAAHGPPSDPVQPSRHTQLVRATLPPTELAPSGHAVHAAEPEAFLNVPTGQNVHVCPSPPVAPGLHRQSVCAAEPCDEYEFAGQT